MEMQRSDLGERTDIGAVQALLPLDGLHVVDIGCGPGTLSRALCELGATVLGVEPDPVQADRNRAAAPAPGLSFVEAGAERLPLDSGSMDGAFFFRSLHHVPTALMADALAEAARVLKPGAGFLCIVEPAMTGSHFRVMRPFHDETRVRTAAQAALAGTADGLFREAARYRYLQQPRHASFEAMVARVTGQTFNDIRREAVETDEVRSLFETGRTAEGDYVFDQPMLLDLYRDPVLPSAG
ncbi:MAG: class I SAM-dependent methyltransferase [Sneathiellaceae bacterium]